MSLVPDYDEDSTSDSAEEPSEVAVTSTSSTGPGSTRLPRPDFLQRPDSTETNLPKTSVFVNPYVQAENEKRAILEKHVKMIGSKDNVRVINGKKVCWNYRKGRCRFGHNCIYAHDSDLQKTKEQLEEENQVQQTVLCQSQLLPQPTHAQIQEMTDAVSSKKRKRPGLTQGLVPGKKVLKNFIKHKK